MNAVRRKELKRALEMLYEAGSIIEECKDEENDALDNLPDGIANSERGEQMESNVFTMDEVVNSLEEIADDICGLIDD